MRAALLAIGFGLAGCEPTTPTLHSAPLPSEVADRPMAAATGSDLAVVAPPPPSAMPPPVASAAVVLEPASLCSNNHADFSKGASFRHTRSALSAKSGSPRHSVSDVVVRRGEAAALRGKFTFGKVRKDLEDEEIRLLVRGHDCRFREVGSGFTNDDGWVSLQVPATLTDKPGSYLFQLVVAADGSRATGEIWVHDPGQAAVLFDIDATLTESDKQIALEVLFGEQTTAQPDASTLARQYSEAGARVVYVTGRPTRLLELTRQWLTRQGFPPGPVLGPEELEEVIPTAQGVGAFKLRTLQAVKRSGLNVVLGYGNAKTDICAYTGAGIDPRRVFIVGPNSGAGCEGGAPTAPFGGYAEHLGKAGSFLGR